MAHMVNGGALEPIMINALGKDSLPVHHIQFPFPTIFDLKIKYLFGLFLEGKTNLFSPTVRTLY
ncbi:hypothetical protein HanPI659440_Chr08g0307051 [Helianthus annuus]|nr:hypothetical protein HanPI659440_Chr08g0307051 [Helianthus annuus]